MCVQSNCHYEMTKGRPTICNILSLINNRLHTCTIVALFGGDGKCHSCRPPSFERESSEVLALEVDVRREYTSSCGQCQTCVYCAFSLDSSILIHGCVIKYMRQFFLSKHWLVNKHLYKRGIRK